MPDEPRQLTQGLLDALVLTPVGPLDSAPEFLDVQITGLPGIRAQLKVAAARELQDALNILLGPKETPELAALVRRLFDVYDRPCEPNGDWKHAVEYQEVETQVRKLVGASPRRDRF